MRQIRTDLAREAWEIWNESTEKTTALKGIEAWDEEQDGFTVSTVKILDLDGEKALCKPAGTYITVELSALTRREENAFSRAAGLLSQKIRELLPLPSQVCVLVAGLGNRAITPDAVGPEAADTTMVTRHLKERMPKDFAPFRPVCALKPGVTGTTGVESAELIRSVCNRVRPGAVIAVDALASRKAERLCRTVQLANTGIVPGSGVGNHRTAINWETLNVPVIAIGVPTVVDAGTLAADIASSAGLPDSEVDTILSEWSKSAEAEGEMIVTPRDIDRSVRDVGKLIGYAINLAMHDGLTIEDIDMFLS